GVDNRSDGPAAVSAAQQRHGVALLVGPHLGTSADDAGVLCDVLPPSLPVGAHIILYAVGSSDAAANTAVEGLAEAVAQCSGYSAEVVYATSGPGVGFGGAAVIEAARGHSDVHILPLFVTEG